MRDRAGDKCSGQSSSQKKLLHDRLRVFPLHRNGNARDEPEFIPPFNVKHVFRLRTSICGRLPLLLLGAKNNGLRGSLWPGFASQLAPLSSSVPWCLGGVAGFHDAGRADHDSRRCRTLRVLRSSVRSERTTRNGIGGECRRARPFRERRPDPEAQPGLRVPSGRHHPCRPCHLYRPLRRSRSGPERRAERKSGVSAVSWREPASRPILTFASLLSGHFLRMLKSKGPPANICF